MGIFSYTHNVQIFNTRNISANKIAKHVLECSDLLSNAWLPSIKPPVLRTCPPSHPLSLKLFITLIKFLSPYKYITIHKSESTKELEDNYPR